MTKYDFMQKVELLEALELQQQANSQIHTAMVFSNDISQEELATHKKYFAKTSDKIIELQAELKEARENQFTKEELGEMRKEYKERSVLI